LTCAACGGDPAAPAVEGPAAGWATLAPLAGGPRQETAVVTFEERVAVLGGFNGTGQVVTDVELYDPAADAWTAGTPLPESMHHANIVVAGGRLYVLGALRGIAFQATGAAYAFDPVSGAWTALASMPAGTERGSSAVGVIGATIYVAGGFRAAASVADASAYDIETDTWEALPDLPEPRDHLVGAVVDGVLYAIGGRDGSIDGNSGEVVAFDPQVGAWSARAPMPTPRSGAAAAVVGGRILVAGGEGNPEDPRGVFDDNEAYDPALDAWEILAPMPRGRHGTGGAALDGRLFVPGGADRQGFGAVDTHEAYTAE
jgi:N-acetylneuraminic acid mutarotase